MGEVSLPEMLTKICTAHAMQRTLPASAGASEASRCADEGGELGTGSAASTTRKSAENRAVATSTHAAPSQESVLASLAAYIEGDMELGLKIGEYM